MGKHSQSGNKPKSSKHVSKAAKSKDEQKTGKADHEARLTPAEEAACCVLLSRDEFRERVFKRNGYKCVFCGETATDAHHILERRLWENRGYFLCNGAGLCNDCHLAVERTQISCGRVRAAAGCTHLILPAHFPKQWTYDKWGNVVCGDALQPSSVSAPNAATPSMQAMSKGKPPAASNDSAHKFTVARTLIDDSKATASSSAADSSDPQNEESVRKRTMMMARQNLSDVKSRTLPAEDDLEAIAPRHAGCLFEEDPVQKVLKESNLMYLFQMPCSVPAHALKQT